MAKANLSGIVSDVRGTVGGEVMTRGRTGEVLKRRPRYRYPTKPTQQAVQDRMKAVMAAYNGLTQAQAMAWNDYARTLTRHSGLTGQSYHPTGQNIFAGLASKFLQINPAGTIPLDPPAADFDGDFLQVTAAGGTGQILFTASDPNTPEVQTELLVQPLKNARRAPAKFYRSAAFVSFVGRAPSYALTLPAGWYATAYRFVSAQTGQMTQMATLGTVEVA
jgi:hypothetical protein